MFGISFPLNWVPENVNDNGSDIWKIELQKLSHILGKVWVLIVLCFKRDGRLWKSSSGKSRIKNLWKKYKTIYNAWF